MFQYIALFSLNESKEKTKLCGTKLANKNIVFDQERFRIRKFSIRQCEGQVNA